MEEIYHSTSMETILENLERLPIHRRTTYKKIAELNDETQILSDSPPSILGNGFLFQNRTVDRVRDRLRRMENQSDQHPGQQVTKSTQIQAIADLYAGAEDLEKQETTSRPAHKKSFPAFEEATQILTDASPLAMSVNDEIITGSAKEGQSTVQIKKTQAMQPIEETVALESVQKIAEAKETQLLPLSIADDQRSQTPIRENLQTDRGLEPFQVTQLDNNRSLLFQATVSGSSRPASILKIQELQKELENGRFKKNQKQNIEYKKPHKTVNTKRTFSKQSFLEKFDEDLSSDGEPTEIRQKDFCTKEKEKRRDLSSDVSYQKQAMFSVYEHNLKLELDSGRRISLDDDDSDGSIYLFSSRASKATVLDIKARKAKQEPRSQTKQNTPTTIDLIHNLKKASRKQISNHQRELMERRGYKLEDIEKEKEEVESLLEQEIARNKRIAQRERRLAKTEDSDEELDRSANESVDTETSDEDTDEVHFGSGNEGENLNFSNNERQNRSKDQSSERSKGEEDNSENVDDDEDSIPKRRTKFHKTLIVEDGDSDEERPLLRNVIDLGPYGNNLDINQNDGASGMDSPIRKIQSVAPDEKRELDLLRKKIQRNEIRQKRKEQRFKNMKAQGLGNMFEMEAEESEDEWRGIGGRDEEFSEDYDSELEEMIDDFTRSNENFDDVRQLLAKEDRELDEKMVNKILHDIKNGGFRKRGRNALEMDWSDAEDDDLRAYRLKRRELIRKSRLENKENENTFKNLKSKAFLESMVEDIDELKNPFEEAALEGEHGTEYEAQEAETGKHTISQEFVRQTLSFLDNSRGSQEFEMEGHITEMGVEHDVSYLKRCSSIHMIHDSSNFGKTDSKSETFDDEFTGASPNSRSLSLVKSFSLGSDPNNKFQSGKKTVTVSKSYRAVGGNRSSITYFGKMRKLVAPKKNIRSISKFKNPSRFHMGTLLETQENHFET